MRIKYWPLQDTPWYMLKNIAEEHQIKEFCKRIKYNDKEPNLEQTSLE